VLTFPQLFCDVIYILFDLTSSIITLYFFILSFLLPYFLLW